MGHLPLFETLRKKLSLAGKNRRRGMEAVADAVRNGDAAAASTTEQFLQQARRRGRKKFPSDEKIRVILEGMRRARSRSRT